MTVAEELILGLQTLVLGMAVTFVGLAILRSHDPYGPLQTAIAWS